MKHYFKLFMPFAIIIAIFVITECSKLENPTNIESENISSNDLTQEQIDQQIYCLKKASGTESTMAASGYFYQRSEVVSPKNNQEVTSPVQLKWTRCFPPDFYSFYCYYPTVFNSQGQQVAMGTVSNQNTLEWSVSLDPGDYWWNILATWKNGQLGDWGPSAGYFTVVAELQVSEIIGPYIFDSDEPTTWRVDVEGGNGSYTYKWNVKNYYGQHVCGPITTSTLSTSQMPYMASGYYKILLEVKSGPETENRSKWVLNIK